MMPNRKNVPVLLVLSLVVLAMVSQIECSKKPDKNEMLKNMLRTVLFGSRVNTKLASDESFWPLSRTNRVYSSMETQSQATHINGHHLDFPESAYISASEDSDLDSEMMSSRLDNFLLPSNNKNNNNNQLARRNGVYSSTSTSYDYEQPCYGFPLEINIRSRIKPEDIFPIKGNSQFKKCIKLDHKLPSPDRVNIRLNYKPTPRPDPYPYPTSYSGGKYSTTGGIHYDE